MIASNESRLEAAHYSEALTAFTVGWRDPAGLDQLLDFVAPPVMVGRRFEYKSADNAEAFFSESDDARAIGATFKRVEYRGTSNDAKTLNRGLTLRVDHDEVSGDDWRERYVQVLLQRLYRNELRRAIAALDEAAVASTPLWDHTSNPDGDLRHALITAAQESGLRPNRILFGETAWDVRADAYEAQDNAGAASGATLKPEGLAQKLFVDGVRIASARYQSGPSSKTEIAGGAVYLFFGQQALAKDEPATLKRFITPTEDGRPFRVYVEETAKYTDLTVEHYSHVIATSTLGVRKLNVSAS